MWKKMYQMKLGEAEMNLPNGNEFERIVRVPGGWIYTYGYPNGTASNFIPWSNEFQTFDDILELSNKSEGEIKK